MSTLLLKLQGNATWNRTIWPPKLYVYDDVLIYSKRKWFVVKEVSIAYSHISQVVLNKGIFFASMEIETTASENILIRYVPKGKAVQAKKIIDQKVYHAHAKHHPDASPNNSEWRSYEKSLSRLKELVAKGEISEKEFEKKKDVLIRTIR